MKKNENGFGVIEILLVIAVIGLTVAVMWLFINRQSAVKPPSNANSQTNVVARSEYNPVIPEGWVKQTDSITGVMYAIPEEFTIKDPNNASGANVEVQNKYAHIQTSSGDTIFNDGTFSDNRQQWVLNDGKGTLNSDVKQSDVKIQDKYTTWYTHFGEGMGGGAYYTFSLYVFTNDKLYTINFKANACDPSIKFDGEGCTKEPYLIKSFKFDDIRNQFVKTIAIPS